MRGEVGRCQPVARRSNAQLITSSTKRKRRRTDARYHAEGRGPTTRLFQHGLEQAGTLSGTLLDIGSGIGSLTFGLLDRGVTSAVAVDASSAYNWIDPVASVLIGLRVIYSSWSLIRQSVTVLMEGAPGHIDVDAVRTALLELPRIANVHDLHVGRSRAASSRCPPTSHARVSHNHDRLLRAARTMPAERFGIRHTTIQIDPDVSCEGADHPPLGH